MPEQDQLESAPQSIEELEAVYNNLTPFSQAALLYLTTTSWRETDIREIYALWKTINHPIYHQDLVHADGHVNQLLGAKLITGVRIGRGKVDSLAIKQDVEALIFESDSISQNLPVLPPEESLGSYIAERLKGPNGYANYASLREVVSSLRATRLIIYHGIDQDPEVIARLLKQRAEKIKGLMDYARLTGSHQTPDALTLRKEQDELISKLTPTTN